MDWKTRAADLWLDVKRWSVQALGEWGDAIKDDPVQHIFSFAAGLALALGVFMVL